MGVLLLVVPWSAFWERNYFADVVPVVGLAAKNFYVRGAVSGLGLVNLAAGVSELISVFSSRRR